LSRSFQTAGREGGDFNDEAIKQTTTATYVILIFGAVYFLWRFYILLLINLVETKQFSWFKVFTCCRWELRSFVRANMVRDASNTGETIGVGRQYEVYPVTAGDLRATPSNSQDSMAKIPINIG